VALAAVLVSTLIQAPRASVVSATPADRVAEPVGAYRDARARLATAEADLAGAERDRDDAQRRWADADRVRSDAEARVARERDRYAALSAEVYVRQGSDERGSSTMQLALAGRKEQLEAARGRLADSEREADSLGSALADRQEVVQEATAARDRLDVDTDRAGATVARTLDAEGVDDLSATAYLAYVDAAAFVAADHPACGISAAVLAGMGRIASGHGRNRQATVDHFGHVQPALRGLQGRSGPDTDGGTLDGDPSADVAVGPLQLTPSQWARHGVDADGDGLADPDGLVDAAATAGEVLCAGAAVLDTYPALEAALTAMLGDGQQTAVVLGSAQRYARATGLDLGTLPVDPRLLATDGLVIDTGDAVLAPGDVTGMIGWAMTRLGTPYSQCLGPGVRPQDPVCPPGTNRFGSSFFDCSGFVSHAYRLIGLKVPQTTYAMEADSRFMATMVSSRIDLRVMQPGDVFLMDGHTGMYVGGGMIVHAIGRGLTYEPVPAWVANGTIAVLRPMSMMPPTPPALALPDLATLAQG
jgi:hypothetical protein